MFLQCIHKLIEFIESHVTHTLHIHKPCRIL